MPAIGDITLTDNAPVSVVFTPRVANPEGSILAKRGYVAANDFAAADMFLTLGVSPSSPQRPTTRVKTSISLPDPDYLATDTDTMSVARFKGEWIIPDNFTQANRDHLQALVESWVINANLKAAVEDDEGLY